MGYFVTLQSFFVLGLILGLLLVGLFIALQSGVVRLASPQGVQLLLGNLSRVLIRVFGYLIGFLAVQQFIGFPIGLIW